MSETSATAEQTVDADAVGPARRGRITRRRVIWVFVAGIVAVVVAVPLTGKVWLAGFQPLTAGGSQPYATSSTDAWEVDSFLVDGRALMVKNDYGATLTLHQEIHNASSRSIKIIDPGPALADWRQSHAPCLWQPVRAQFTAVDEDAPALEVPFRLEPGESIMLELIGRIGEPGCDGPKSAFTGSEIAVPLRFSVFGISRTQSIPLGLTIWETDEPERGLGLDIRKLEAD
ncbi:hypothetical protein [Streptomyces sp. NBC_00620]|uniref:hypothetical protein n=1 Tax=Streptomyces sp. NBC_00620 TaxID=2903666 RepID=UPI00225BA46F|nr:hypothetical protein [Streptomyces sp. NBC_00620]MCX4972767.1 hypothetical protein [Streptomyces sp. NBC_00620]